MLRLLYCKLEGYIGIYNGLGLDKIEIDFSKCKNLITIIAGPNGTGKSTIIKALQPLPDSADNYRPSCNAGKTLVFGDGDVVYQIEIVSNYTNGKRTNSAYFSKNGTELNPTGNISSYKETLFSVFDIDANFVAMSQISAEDRGLADKTPAERKKLISSKIDSLEIYTEIYRNLNKKANIFKSHLNSIAAKLQNMGDKSAIEARLVEIEKSVLALTTTIEDNRETITRNEEKIKVLDPSGETWKMYEQCEKEIVENGDIITANLDRLQKVADELEISGAHGITGNPDALKSNIEDLIAKSEKEIATLQGKNAALFESLNEIAEKKGNIEVKISQKLQEHVNSDDYQNIEQLVATSNEKHKLMDQLCQEISGNRYFTNSGDPITIDKATSMLEIAAELQSIQESAYPVTADELEDMIRYHIIKIAKDTGSDWAAISKQIASVQNTNTGIKEDLENNLRNVEDQIVRAETIIAELESNDLQIEIPDKCNLADKCYLAMTLTSKKENYHNAKNMLEQLQKDKRELERDIDEVSGQCSLFDMIANRVSSIYAVYRYLKGHFRTIYSFFLENEIGRLDCIDDLISTKYIRVILSRLEEIREYHNFLVEYTRLDRTVSVLDRKIAENVDTTKLIEDMKQDLNSLDAEYNHINYQMNGNNKIIETEIIKKGKAKEQLEKVKVYQDLDRSISVMQAKQRDLMSVRAKIKESAEQAEHLYQSLNGCKEIVNNAMERLKEVSDEKRKLEAQLLVWDQFQQEYQEYKEKYEYINVLRKYSSPTQGGIQGIYMSMYMNKTLDLSNELLSMLFGGQYRLLEYVINDQEFRIPFIGGGLVVDDISSGSSSQKAIMGGTISLVTTSSSSSIYRIPSLDELDAGLDQSNRMIFSDVIIKACQILNIPQLISISHSIESSVNNVDVILLSDDQNYVDQFANSNIIYQYHKSI